MRVIFALGAIILCLLVVGSSLAPGTHAASSMAKDTGWEHLAFSCDATGGVSNPDTSRQIVQLGRDGWQLVSVEGVLKDGTTVQRVYYFKRPR